MNKEKLPGNESLPTSKEELLKLEATEKDNYAYCVEDYFQKPKQSEFKLSPNGLALPP